MPDTRRLVAAGGDGITDDVDSDVDDRFVCIDEDGDVCHECSSGHYTNVNDDGLDYDGDGLCDDFDECDNTDTSSPERAGSRP